MLKLEINLLKLEDCNKFIHQILANCLYSSENNNVFICGEQNDNNYLMIRNSFLKKEVIIPYVESDNEYADLSPIVCGYDIMFVNDPSTVIVFDYIVGDLSIFKNLKNVYMMYTDENKYSLQYNIHMKYEKKINNFSNIDDKYTKNKDNIYKSDSKKMQDMYNSYKKNSETSEQRSDKSYEKTLCVLKPSVIKRGLEFVLLNKLSDSGCIVSYYSRRRFSSEVWKLFYKEHEKKSFYNSLCDYMNNEFIGICIIDRINAISYIRDLIGNPDPLKCKRYELRYIYGVDLNDNGIHASDSQLSYERERDVLFNLSRNMQNAQYHKK